MIESLLCGGAPAVATGQQNFTTAGTFNFVVPNNVTELNCYLQGAGGGGGYGNTSYRGTDGGPGAIGKNLYSNNVPVTPGETLTVIIGVGGNTPGAGTATQLLRSGTVLFTAAGGAAGYNSSSTDTSESHSGRPGPAAPAVPGLTGVGTGNRAPGSGGNGGKGYGFNGGLSASKGINGAMRIIWGKNRAFPSMNVADMKVV